MALKVFIFAFTLLLTTGCWQQKSSLLIATSANAQHALMEVGKAFTLESGLACEIVVGSSGKLSTQIVAGAPYDVFVSADTLYPHFLYKKQLTDTIPQVYAQGYLILWSSLKSSPPNVNQLKSTQIRHIAIPNPRLAPYGKAAQEVLENEELWKLVEKKLVLGESISQTNQFLLSGGATFGFTSKSSLFGPLKSNGTWIEIPAHLYTPLRQSAVVLKNAPHHKEAELFFDFLLSDKAEKILSQYGYKRP